MSKVESSEGKERRKGGSEGGWWVEMAGGAMGMALWATGGAEGQSSEPGGRD